MERTTIRLDPELLAEAKKVAASTGRTLTRVIEESLREMLARQKTQGSRQGFVPLPKSAYVGGLRPGVNIDSSARLRDILDEDLKRPLSWSINVLIHAFRPLSAGDTDYERWLMEALEGPELVGLSDLVLSGFMRILTNPRAFDPPEPIESVVAFTDSLRAQPNTVLISPGERHWSIFRRLCLDVGASSNLVPDAYFAALAIESGSEWITTDEDFKRFPGLRWRHPLK